MYDDCSQHNTQPRAVFPSAGFPACLWPAATGCVSLGLVLSGSLPQNGSCVGPLTRWDVRVLARSALLTALALVLGWLVTAVTDEGGVPWGERAGRTLPLTPLCAAIGVWVALAPATARGEGRALAALGRSRFQVAAAAVVGAGVVAAGAALLLASRNVDARGFFPSVLHATGWRWDGHVFVDPARGLFVTAEGAPEKLALAATEAGDASSPGSLPVHGRVAAALAMAIAGVAMPLLLAHSMLTRPADRRFGRDDAKALLAAGVSVAASVVFFQAAAARALPALLGAAPPMVLLLFAVQRYRAAP
jgi:hypothetical protein